MLSSVVELIACWSGKFFRIKTKVLWRMLLHCLMWFVWRERNTRTFEGMKDRFMSWSFSAFILCLNGQILRVFLLSTLCLICFFFVLSLLLSFYFFVAFSTLPVCFFPLYFLISYFNEFYYQKKKKEKEKKEKKKKPLLQASLDILPWWVQITSLSTTVHLLWGLFNFVLFYMCWGKGGRILER